MSHFVVMVRLPAEVREDDIEDAVGRALEPYCEHENEGRSKRFMVFEDVEAEYRKEYETDTVEMVRCEDGTLAYPWDERFRVKGTFGSGTGTHEPPAHLKREKIPQRERFASFEAFITDWASYKRNPDTGKYGYWKNPNAKWDWWVIGGRWPGRLGGKDVARIADLDLNAATGEARAKVEEFRADLDAFLSEREWSVFEGWRGRRKP